MERYRIMLAIMVLNINLFATNELNNLQLSKKIEKDNEESVLIRREFIFDEIVDISIFFNKNIDGIAISGAVKLESDSSMVNVLLVDDKGSYFLVAEFSSIYCELGKNIFIDRMDETFCLDNVKPMNLVIQIKDAEFTCSELKAFTIKEKNKEKRQQLHDELHREITDAKLINVKNYIKKNKMIWSADHTFLSSMPYSAKRKLYGDKFNLYGFDYYNSGFFEIKKHVGSLKSTSIETFVDEFDWRNRHGINWITPNTCQSGCFINGAIDCSYITEDWSTDSLRCVNNGGEFRNVGTCWAFSAVGTVESLVNLYFNKQIHYDLSEQQVISCAYGFAEPWDLEGALKYMRDYYVVDEYCYPYIADNGNCNGLCENPTDRVSFENYNYVSSESELKASLILHGPLATKMYEWPHVLVCVGWGTINVGDYIDISGGLIQPNDPNIGRTYWMLKQSNTYTGWPYHTGYIYTMNKPDWAYWIEMPITSDVYSEEDIECKDNDNDGYFWWGIGPKPATCPFCTPDEPDGDDSSPNYGPIDEFGNLIVINQPYQHPETTISTTENLVSDINLCGDLKVTDTGNLIINGATVNLIGNSSLQVDLGGELLIVQGEINKISEP